MNRAPRIRLTPDEISNLLNGEVIETLFRGPRVPARGESYPVTMQDPTEVRAVIVGSKLRPRCKRVWNLTVVLDRSESPLLLNAESKGGVINPLPDEHSEMEAAAHGYTDRPGRHVLDAGEGVPHEQVETSAQTQEAARRFAEEKVDVLAKRRARSMANRVHNALMQTRAHGVDPNIEVLAEWLEDCEQAVREAA